ncbi:12901_t:CDS:10 [Funneliformis mosseae]|uniref:phosphatidylserine decarboxylase n=1 Tax=Funneliformis mosseae TaxID=27381 RepID=A0A9N9D9V4_FUNMO|nr:12901_t:CDS:10 [Funneliformis mosseae]
MSEFNVVLRVNIIEAKDLAAKDRNGFSDPFITMNIDDATDQTQVINKSLNPRWDAVFDHKIDPENPPKQIHMTCWDKDVFGRDYMGEIFISLENLWGNNNGCISYNDMLNLPQWYPLTTTRKSEDVSGQVLVKIGLIDKDNKFIDAREWNSFWRKINNLSIEEVPAPVVIEASPPTVKPTHARTDSLFTLSEIVGVVFLEIVCALDLPAEKNMTGLGFDMDPFVVVSFAKNTFRTKIIDHNLNPEWNEKLHFPVKRQECGFQIKFSVYDWDKFSQNDHVASKLYDIKPLIDRGLKNISKSQDLLKDMEDGLVEEVLPLEIHSKEKLAKKHNSKLVIKTKFIPYEQLRRQFWFALAKNYDSDGNNLLNYVELETMLSSLGSTLTQETISNFFTRFGRNPTKDALKFDEVVTCLEQYLGDASISHHSADVDGEEADNEHLIYLQNCPICNRPNLDQLSETNIITHIAMCASSDWGNVDKFVTGDFVTESQAQRKWVSKVISKVGFGGYKIGGNNANIIVQDRLTGQLTEEKMATYVRLGIRLLYKGVGNVDSTTTKNLLESLSVKQGKKFNHPSSAGDINAFIRFHRLKVDEIADPLDSFKNFNEFFYRKLKPSARPCDSPTDPHVLVSPADCRMMAFPTINSSTELWIKGQNFSVAKLIDDESIAQRYEGGSLGIFRLAPQDYHRFHFPVEGELEPVKHIPGAFYTVNPMAIRSTLDVYGENKRAVCYINSPQFGKVAFIAIGAMMVGSIVFTSTPGSYVKRTDEHGYFAFGKMYWDEDLLANSKTCLETLVRVGMHVGRGRRKSQMDKNNYFQEIQNQCSYQGNFYNNINSYNYTQNCFYENLHIDPKLLQLNATNSYSAGQNYSPQPCYHMTSINLTDNFSETTCADCLITYAPTWRIRQDGKKVCNACGLYRRKYGSKRPLEVTREGKVRVKRRNISANQPKVCANCGISESTCWRRVGGERHCNACGLFAKINGQPRRVKKFFR